MSGHNKWSKIKHQKQANDLKKGKIFSKLSKQIAQAVREGGADEDLNPALRSIVEQAKAESMPADNIERAINRGEGKDENGESLIFEAVTYEGFGPNGGSVIVDVMTDNTNRVISDIRTIFNDHNGNLGENGSVTWNFDQKSRLIIKCGYIEPAKKFGEENKFIKIDSEEVMMELMDFEGVQDIKKIDREDGEHIEVITSVSNMGKLKEKIEKIPYIVQSAKVVRLPKTKKEFEPSKYEKFQSLIADLEEYEDVQNVWYDVELEQ